MLKKSEINFLNNLIAREDLKGVKHLEYFLWRNTVKPKYKVGDVVKFDDYNQYHYGVQPIGWVGIIEEIYYCYDYQNNNIIRYKIRYESLNKKYNEVVKHTTYQNESAIITRCRIYIINLIPEPKNNNSDYSYL